MHKVSLKKIHDLKKRHIGITSITAYDASFAKFFDDLGFDIILIGDSLGEVIKGDKNTHNVSLKEMIYHAQSVSNVVNKSYVIADLPKESCSSHRKIISDSVKLFNTTRIDMIKIEFNTKNILRLVETDDIFIGIKKIENKYVLNEKNQNQIIKIYRPDVKKNSINSWQGRLCWNTPFICSYYKLEVKKKNSYLIIKKLKE